MQSLKVFLKKYWLILLIVILAIWWFQQNDNVVMNESRGGDYAMEEMAFDDGYAASRSLSVAAIGEAKYDSDDEQKVMRSASLDLHVTSVEDTAAELGEYVEGLSGSILSSNIWRGEGSYSASISVRIPADRFEEAMVGLKGFALYVESEYVDADDVTEEYTDLEARLTNYQAEEAQYVAIMERANSVEEILKVTQSLSNVRYQIERIQGQLNYYDNRVDYSTISVSLNEDESVSNVAGKWLPGSTASEALSDFVVFLQSLVDKGIYLAVFGWPILLIALWFWMKKRKR